ncbi:hypothetical protein BLNAU_23295 [Blattamonas nauphoetae]|uniref:Uncharacterized protein n=1 Tax=Blattamonas nauphoetae TaxID=2049346 RepID=A0ABQ9WQP6_9EUKA|nr:hypothetical protein BLNAU_23295 [Blattamonas nauphoetae]
MPRLRTAPLLFSYTAFDTPTNPSQHDAPNSTHHPPLTSPTRISSVIFSQEADTSFSAAIPSIRTQSRQLSSSSLSSQIPYPRNVHSNRIVLSSPTRQQNSSTLPLTMRNKILGGDRDWLLPHGERGAFDESHNEPTISEATKKENEQKFRERFGLQKMIGAKEKEKSQQQLDNPIAQPRAETSKKDEEATSIQVGREDDQEEGETVEEEGETGNFQSRTEEEENTNQSSIQPNSSVESTHSPHPPNSAERTLRQRDPVTKQAITGNRLKSNFSHPLNSTSSQTPKERQKQSPKLPNRRRPQNESENHQFRSINLLSLQSVHYLSYTTQTSQTNSK